MNTCLQCSLMCCTVRETRSPCAWLCYTTIKSSSLLDLRLPLIHLFFTSTSITQAGCLSRAVKNWWVFRNGDCGSKISYKYLKTFFFFTVQVFCMPLQRRANVKLLLYTDESCIHARTEHFNNKHLQKEHRSSSGLNVTG